MTTQTHQDITDRPIQADSEPIRSLLFSRVESNLHLYVTTDSSALCYQNMQNRKRLGVAGGTLFDLSAKGTLVGSPKDDNASIYEFDDSRKIQSWNLEGEKLVCVVMLCTIRNSNSSRTTTYCC